METNKRIVCLANSRKLSGRCIAGKEVKSDPPGKWIRPVSAREHQEVSERERQYEDGADPAVLDIIDIPLLERVPNVYQQENWLLDPEYYWVKTGEASWTDLSDYVDPPNSLWFTGNSTYHGENDQIQQGTAQAQIRSSLRLVHVDILELSVFAPQEAFGNPKRRVQARFSHCGDDYRLWVTDPVYETRYLAQSNGEHQLGESYLTISLGEPYKGHVSKLVATIIEKDPAS